MKKSFTAGRGTTHKGVKGVGRPRSTPSYRDVVRETYLKEYPELKKRPETGKPSNKGRDISLTRSLARQGSVGARASGIHTPTFKQTLALEAAISGLASGHTSGTIPERLVAAWLVKAGYRFGGQGLGFNPYNADWGFQVALIGGRHAVKGGGGAVADIFLTPQATNTRMGVVVRVQGAYWHMQSDRAARDEVQKRDLELLGYKVTDLWDYEVIYPGQLEAKMSLLLVHGYRTRG